MNMMVNLVSGPRNISTALMYSFAQRNDTTVTDEPFYASYLKRTGLEHPGRQEVLKSQSHNAERVFQELLNSDVGDRILFIKNMAQHMEDLPEQWFDSMTNVFLIRDPKEVITSFSKVIPNPSIKDIGLEAQVRIMRRIVDAGGDPIVIDMEELLKDPRKVLSTLCRMIDIPFQERMMKWEPRPRKEDGIWAEYWYSSVHASTGFGIHKKKNETLPEHLGSLYDQAMLYYQNLKTYAIES